MSKKTIAVTGATGLQGGSVVNSLLNFKDSWNVRALTRNPNSEAAKQLKQKGVEVVECDCGDAASVRKAFQGAYAVFAVTNFWEHGAEGEVKQGKLMADIAEEMGVQHYIWSTLPNVRKITGGKYGVEHFTGKALVEDYVRTKNIPFQTFVAPSFYFQNLWKFDTFKPHIQDGKYVFSIPFPDSAPVAMVNPAEAVGPIVYQALSEKDKWNSKIMPIYAENVTMAEYAKTFSEVSGKPARYEVMDRKKFMDQYAKFGAFEIMEMMDYFLEYGYYPKNDKEWDLTLPKQLYPNMQTLRQYLEKERPWQRIESK